MWEPLLYGHVRQTTLGVLCSFLGRTHLEEIWCSHIVLRLITRIIRREETRKVKKQQEQQSLVICPLPCFLINIIFFKVCMFPVQTCNTVSYLYVKKQRYTKLRWPIMVTNLIRTKSSLSLYLSDCQPLCYWHYYAVPILEKLKKLKSTSCLFNFSRISESISGSSS